MGADVGDDSAFMSERTTSTPASPVGSEAESPRLRLAGTNAGPMTEEEQKLLHLRAGLVRACALHGADAASIRERLDRLGRKDPIEVATGTDAFSRAAAAMESMLSRIDARLAEIDAARSVTIEIDAKVSDLIRRS